LDLGHACVSVDLKPDDLVHPGFTSIRGDIRDRAAMKALFAKYRFGGKGGRTGRAETLDVWFLGKTRHPLVDLDLCF
jgi:hypothetical protein